MWLVFKKIPMETGFLEGVKLCFLKSFESEAVRKNPETQMICMAILKQKL